MTLEPPTWQTVDVDGAMVRVMTAGSGDPLLFLHGWGLSPRTYADGITRLTGAGLQVIAPALPGFGGSDGPPLRSLDLRVYSRQVGRLLDVLGVEHPAFVVGHSFGGGVGISLATHRPERVRSLTLLNSVGGAPGQRTGLADASWLKWMVGTLSELSPRDIARSTPGMLRDFLPNVLRHPLTMALTAKLALTVDLAEEAELLVASGVPVLFFWGDGDKLILPGALRSIAGSLPSEVVQGRHGWLLARPEEFASLVRDALVVHAMLERKQRGQALVLPKGSTLADLIPPERRLTSRTSRARLESAL